MDTSLHSVRQNLGFCLKVLWLRHAVIASLVFVKAHKVSDRICRLFFRVMSEQICHILLFAMMGKAQNRIFGKRALNLACKRVIAQA